MARKVEKTRDEWSKLLSDKALNVARDGGTEHAFTGEYNDHKGDGVYQCVCCGEALFDSKQKYDSGSGWPSYWAPVEEKAIEEKTDRSLGMTRTEVLCDACGAHLGHVFPDGPKPTGLRYCINSASLNFAERGASEEEAEEDALKQSPGVS